MSYSTTATGNVGNPHIGNIGNTRIDNPTIGTNIGSSQCLMYKNTTPGNQCGLYNDINQGGVYNHTNECVVYNTQGVIYNNMNQGASYIRNNHHQGAMSNTNAHQGAMYIDGNQGVIHNNTHQGQMYDDINQGAAYYDNNIGQNGMYDQGAMYDDNNAGQVAMFYDVNIDNNLNLGPILDQNTMHYDTNININQGSFPLAPIPPVEINNDDVAPLPLGIIEEILNYMNAAQGGNKIVPKMLSSLYHLNVDNQFGNNITPNVMDADSPNGANNGDKKKKWYLDADEINSMRNLIFSNIGILGLIPKDLRETLLYSGRLPSIRDLTLEIKESEDPTVLKAQKEGIGEHNKFTFITNFLPKLSQLKTLNLTLIRSASPNSWNPFFGWTTPIIFPNLETFNMKIFTHNYEDYSHPNSSPEGTYSMINTLFLFTFFPKLTNINIPIEFFQLKDHWYVKALIQALVLMPSLFNFTPSKSLWSFSDEFLQQLSCSTLLSRINKLTIPISKRIKDGKVSYTTTTNGTQINTSILTQNPHKTCLNSRNLLLTSPHLTSVKEVEFVAMRQSGETPEMEVSDNLFDWVFGAPWLQKITSLTFSTSCLTSEIASRLIDSRILSGLTSLSFDYPSDENDGVCINAILRSPDLDNLKQLRSQVLYPSHILTLTTAYHLSGLTSLIAQKIPRGTLRAIARSRTLGGLQTVSLPEIISDFYDSEYMSEYNELLQSPNMASFTSIYPKSLIYVSEWLGNVMVSRNLNGIRKLNLARCPCFGKHDLMFRLAINPSLMNLTHLDLSNCALTDEHVKALAESPYVRNLTHLNLDGNPRLGDDSLIYLSKSHNFENLKELILISEETYKSPVHNVRGTPLQFGNEALLALFQSKNFYQIEKLNIVLCVTLHFEAINYLFDNPDIFVSYGEELVEKLPILLAFLWRPNVAMPTELSDMQFILNKGKNAAFAFRCRG